MLGTCLMGMCISTYIKKTIKGAVAYKEFDKLRNY